MPKLGLNQIARLLNGTIVNSKKDIIFSDYHFDSRLIKDNCLFFALKTDDNDGHDYIKTLNNKKSVGAIVSKDFSIEGIDIPLIQVDDTFQAVLKLAEAVRDMFSETKYIGITGSAGKTTSKEFLYQILSSKYKVFRSHLNWNNWIGLPFSLLKMDGDEDFAIFELGMSDPGIGEIDLLTGILKPDLALILNVFPVHLEFLKTIENIAIAKSEILNYLSSDSIAFVSGDFDLLVKQANNKIGRIEYFGKTKGYNKILLGNIIRENEVSTFEIEFFGNKTVFKTKLISHAHIENLFAAIIAAKHLGMKDLAIQRILWDLQPLARRGSIIESKDKIIIDESYNSNPEALKKTLSWIDIEYKEKKIAVLGDMLELGMDEKLFHFEAGLFFAKLGFKELITIGSLAEQIAKGAKKGGYSSENIHSFSNINEAEEKIRNISMGKCVMLFKSSRDSGLNVLVEKIYGKK